MLSSSLSGLVTAAILMFGIVTGDPDAVPESPCVKNGCKATAEGPVVGGCAAPVGGNHLVQVTVVLGQGSVLRHGSCHCPEQECVIDKNTCQIKDVGLMVRATTPGHTLEVGGLDFGTSYTWSPGDPIEGCGNSNFEIITIVGPGINCTFGIALRCNSCGFDC